MSAPNPIKRGVVFQPGLVLLMLTAITLVLFAPALSGYFIADDIDYIHHLVGQAGLYVQGQQLDQWFLAYYGPIFLRPVVQWLWLVDFVAWNTQALGYHLTNVGLHILNAFLVYLLARRVMRNRPSALVAGLLFALHPIHAESVPWISDRTDLLSAFFYLLSAVFFILFRQRSRRLYYGVALAAFALAGLTKETTLALPAILAGYDFLFTRRPLRWKMILAWIPFWMIPLGYLAARLLVMRTFGGYSDLGFLNAGGEIFVYSDLVFLARPFIQEMNFPLFLIGMAGLALLGLIFRRRREMWFGMVWIIVAFLPTTLAAYPAERLAYAPSIGLAIAQAAMMAQPLAHPSQFARGLGLGLVSLCLIVYGVSLWGRVDDWAAAGQVTRVVAEQTRALQPTLPPGSKLFYAGVPSILRGIYIAGENFGAVVQDAYHDPGLPVYHSSKFPILSERLDRVFLFEYAHRQLIERPDIVRVLQARQKCLAAATPAIVFDFTADTQQWEPWSQLAPFETRDHALWTQALGNDPFMASPTLDVATLAIAAVEVTMRVRAAVPITRGRIFWQATSQTDFYPALQTQFTVQADQLWHSYHVPIDESQLFVGDRITRLRLDPTQTPAEISIQSIRVLTHCPASTELGCACAP